MEFSGCQQGWFSGDRITPDSDRFPECKASIAERRCAIRFRRHLILLKNAGTLCMVDTHVVNVLYPNVNNGIGSLQETIGRSLKLEVVPQSWADSRMCGSGQRNPPSSV